jgi:hypothetical protein
MRTRSLTTAYLSHSAEITKRLVEESGRKCMLFPGDLREHSVRQELIQKHLEEFKYIGKLAYWKLS